MVEAGSAAEMLDGSGPSVWMSLCKYFPEQQGLERSANLTGVLTCAARLSPGIKLTGGRP
jgi:hypothetical protein